MKTLQKITASLLVIGSLFLLHSCNPFDDLFKTPECSIEGTWYVFGQASFGPYHIRFSGTEAYYDFKGPDSNAQKAVNNGIITNSTPAIINVRRAGENNGNLVWAGEMLFFTSDQNGQINGAEYTSATFEVQTLNTSTEPCNNILFSDDVYPAMFWERLE